MGTNPYIGPEDNLATVEKLPTVLAVDDVNLNLLMFKEALSGLVTLYTAKSGGNALKVLSLVKVDLLLLDLGMPDLDGFAFLEKMRQLPAYENTPVIIVSSNSKQEALDKTLDFGVVDYIVKPFHIAQLREKVIRALGVDND